MSETTQDTAAMQTPDPREGRPPVAARSGRWSWLRRVLVLLAVPLLVVLVLLLVILWLLGTESGLRSALFLGEWLAPDLLQVERAEGRILGDLHLEDLSIRPPGVELRFSNLDLRWHLLKTLTTGTLRVSELSAHKLDIAIVPSEDEKDEEPASGPVELPEIPLPPGLELELGQALVGQLSIGTLGENSRFRIDRIGLAADWSGTQVTIKGLTLSLPEPWLQAEAQGQVALTGYYPLALGLTWDLSQGSALKLAGQAIIGGDLEMLHLENDLTGSARAQLRAQVLGILDRLHWVGELNILEVDLPTLSADLPALDLKGKLTTGGDLDDIWVQGNLVGAAPDLPDIGRLQATLNLSWRGQVLEIAGGLKGDNAYAGWLERLALRTQDFGNWRLQKAAPVTLAGARINVGPLCIREEAGSGGCARFEQREPGSWKAALDLDRLAFDLFKRFIPEDLILTGEATAKANFKATDGTLIGNAKVQIAKGLLGTSEGGSKLLNFTSTQLTLDAGGQGLQTRLAVPLKGLGDLSADVSLPGWNLAEPARPQQPLRGGIKARIGDFGLVSRLAPHFTDLAGKLNADFKLGGTLAKPGLKGVARLTGGGFQVPLIGLEVADLTFDAQARGLDRIEYSGGFKVGSGRLKIDGDTLLGAEGVTTSIRAKGKRLKVADTKEYFVLASPDIQAKIGPTGTKLTGRVMVPKARIRPRATPAGTVSPSPDVVIDSEIREEQSGYATSMDLRLVLGQQVTVDAFGLEGTLRGELAVLQTPGKPIFGDGQLKIADGTYRISVGGPLSTISAAVGTALTIEQGFLSYAKSPITNPHLVILAQREGGDITAGLRVFGTIKHPKMTFFSATDPGMSQSDITKYLLTGIPPQRSGEQQDRTVSLGTYIAPKLFAEYDYSLGDESDKIRLRYDLKEWIELQAETGDAQGGDIFFTIEH